jgi:CspA family cold shock protein
MKFKDQLVRCQACGKQFVYSVREQRRRAEQGLPLDVPAFCTECRGADIRLAEVSVPAPASTDGAQVSTRPATGPTTRPPKRAARNGAPRGRNGSGRRPRGGPAERKGATSPSTQQSGGASGSRPPGRGKGRPRRPAASRQTELRIRYTGTVKWFDEGRGYGFIAQEDGGEVFVHCTAVLGESPVRLEKGQPVEYEVERTDRGLHAVDVVPLAW